MQLKENIPMPREDDNGLDNFGLYEDEESTPEAQNMKRDHRNLVGKSSDTGSCARVGCTSQDRLLGSGLSSSL